MDIKHYFITFGLGTALAKYYAVVQAENEDAARAFMREKSRLTQSWSSVYPVENGTRDLGEHRLLVPKSLVGLNMTLEGKAGFASNEWTYESAE